MGSLTPSRRRRLRWLLVTACVAAGLAAVAIRYPNTAKIEPSVTSDGSPSVYVQPRSVPLTGARKEAAAQVARAFIVDAVLRIDPAAAWKLVTPSLREGTAPGDWRQGNIPVVPFDKNVLKKVKWNLWYSYSDRVGFEVGLIPKPGGGEQVTKFTLELSQVGRGSRGHWLVSSWLPAATLEPAPPSAKPGSAAPGYAGPRGRLGARWLVIPLGLLVLAVLVPLGVATREWRRGVRAARSHRSGSVGS
jgi:hypothetical protein